MHAVRLASPGSLPSRPVLGLEEKCRSGHGVDPVTVPVPFRSLIPSLRTAPPPLHVLKSKVSRGGYWPIFICIGILHCMLMCMPYDKAHIEELGQAWHSPHPNLIEPNMQPDSIMLDPAC